MINRRFGYLKVIRKSDKKIKNTTLWVCKCKCGKIVEVRRTNLISGHTKSCGCYSSEVTKKIFTKYNIYKINGNIVEVKCSNSDNWFIVDKDDWEKLKENCWHKTNCGYIGTRDKEKNKIILIHKKIKEGKIIDHINRNKLDNRKSNLRVVTSQQNSINKSIQSNNKSGIVGVYYDKTKKKWVSKLTFKGKNYFKRFNTKEEARNYRKKLEETYFKEYTPTIYEEVEKVKESWNK